MNRKNQVRLAMLDNAENNFNVSFPGQIADRLKISPSYACRLLRELMSEGFCTQRYCHGPYAVQKETLDECQACKGSGRRWLTEKHTITNEDCPSCNGTGHMSEGGADE